MVARLQNAVCGPSVLRYCPIETESESHLIKRSRFVSDLVHFGGLPEDLRAAASPMTGREFVIDVRKNGQRSQAMKLNESTSKV